MLLILWIERSQNWLSDKLAYICFYIYTILAASRYIYPFVKLKTRLLHKLANKIISSCETQMVFANMFDARKPLLNLYQQLFLELSCCAIGMQFILTAFEWFLPRFTVIAAQTHPRVKKINIEGDWRGYSGMECEMYQKFRSGSMC